MPAPAVVSRRDLDSSWMVLRLALRHAAMQYAPKLVERINTLSGQAMDPVHVETLARKLNEALTAEASQGEQSPTMRFLKKTFRPNEAEKERRNLEKAFNSYLVLWTKSQG